MRGGATGSGCNLDEEGTLSEAVINGSADPHLTTIARAHVSVNAICGGVLIAPDWVLTAAHCIIDNPTGNIYRFDETGAPVYCGMTTPCQVKYNGCYIPPHVGVGGAPITTCAELPEGFAVANKDLALLHLEEPIFDSPTRTIGPRRGCGYNGTFDFAFRGEGDNGYTGTSPVVRTATYLSGTAQPNNIRMDATAVGTPTPNFEAGDSGGGLSWLLEEGAASDHFGPVLAVASGVYTTNPSTAEFAILWEPSNIDWIWSVLDSSGSCTLGSGPCVLREPVPSGGSVCGDQHCSGTESINTCPSDCQAPLADSDGDGVPDPLDLCPHLDGRTLAASQWVNGNHVDADANLLGDDCTPAACVGVCSPDTDGDSVPDACDNCPSVPNPDQLDCDGDGEGAACEADTVDNDGIAPGCDNCPLDYNPSQQNCNEDAERAAGVLDPSANLFGVGDSCDAIRCAETTIQRRTVTNGPILTSKMDRLQMDPRSTDNETARTGFRFCPCSDADVDDVATRGECQLDLGDGTGLCALDFTTYDIVGEVEQWRDLSVLHDLPPAEILSTPHGNEGVHNYLAETEPPGLGELPWEPSAWATWAMASDQSRWSTSGWAFGTDPMPGVLWTHTPGPVGSVFVAADRELSSHYWSGPVAADHEARLPAPCFTYIGRFGGSFSACPDCGASTPIPAVGLRRGSGSCLGGDVVEPALIFREDWLELEDYFAVNPIPYWVQGIPDPADPWVSAVASAARAGGAAPPETQPQHVQLSATADAIERVLSVGPDGFYVDGCGQAGCPAFIERQTSSAMGSPPLRTNFTATLSGQHQLLWFGGGTADNTLLADLWLVRMDSFELFPFNLSGGELDHIVAIHYAELSDVLYVLERFEGAKYQLYRVENPTRFALGEYGGELEVLQTWPMVNPEREVAITTDPSGHVIISTDSNSASCVVRLDPTFSLQDFAKLSGDLEVQSVRADRMGMSAVVLNSNNGHSLTALTHFIQFKSSSLNTCF